MPILTDQQIAGLAVGAGFPPDQVATAVAIALAESSGNTEATNSNTNGTIDRGVWQINSIHTEAQGDMFSPPANARAAKMIWAAAGGRWTPWSTYNNGAYTRYMGRASIAAGTPDANFSGGAPAPGGGGGGGAPPPSVSFDGMSGLFKKLGAASFWVRIGAFFLGLTLIGMGMLDVMGSNKTVQGVAKVAVKTGIKAAMA